MNQTEPDRSTRLAEALFDEVVIPLAKSKRDAVASTYFPMRPGAELRSYLEPAEVRVMKPSDFEFPGGGAAEHLVEALARFWVERGEPELAAMSERMREIASVLGEEVAESDGSVDILCYTLF
jgi:hypothetical protein